MERWGIRRYKVSFRGDGNILELDNNSNYLVVIVHYKYMKNTDYTL